MIKFELEDWIVLKNIFINISNIIDEISIFCYEDGLRFHAIDRSHVCFFECEISKDLFDEYDISQSSYLYIDLTELVKILKRGKSKDILVFESDNEECKIIFKNKNIREFVITQLDINDDSKNLPDMNYSVDFKCDFDFLKNALNDADLYSDRLNFNCKEDCLVLSCEGRLGRYTNKYPFDYILNENCSSSYSIDWLFKICDNKLTSDLKIHMGDDYPMLIEMSSDFVKMNYLLAPRLGE